MTRQAVRARVLIMQASTRLSIPRSIVTPTDQQLALYPHLPSPAGSIPWQDLGRAVRPLFRLRTVQPWETKVGPREIAHVAEKLDQAIGHPVGQGSPGPAISLGEMIEPKEADGQTITTLRYVTPNPSVSFRERDMRELADDNADSDISYIPTRALRHHHCRRPAETG